MFVHEETILILSRMIVKKDHTCIVGWMIA